MTTLNHLVIKQLFYLRIAVAKSDGDFTRMLAQLRQLKVDLAGFVRVLNRDPQMFDFTVLDQEHFALSAILIESPFEQRSLRRVADIDIIEPLQ